MNRLASSTIVDLPVGVTSPSYDRRRLRTGIVHIGVGAFHRAHQAIYTEKLIEAGDTRWGILGVHLRERRMADLLASQDFLYSVTERHGDAATTRVVGCLIDSVYAPAALSRAIDAIANPQTAVVTTTVTEKGYSMSPSTGELDTDDPGIRHDLADPHAPQTTLGVLAAAIRRRPVDAPLTVVCCDNMARNGATLRRLLRTYADIVSPALARRIDGDIAFPDSMVDRIVPAATAASLAEAQSRLGLRDEAAIVCEPFTQWVVENRFAGPRPAWEDAGALLTTDVSPYQAMKLRLLNGTHSAIAYVGQLRGLETVSDAMADPPLAAFARAVMAEDLLSTVKVPAGYDVRAYCDDLIRRFQNPTLAHRTQQIAMDGTQKVAVRWLPALRETLAAGRALPSVERALAAWLHYLAVERDDAGRALVISDPGAEPLASRLRAAGTARDAVRAALSHTPVFGSEPWPAAFADRLAGHLNALREGGTDALLHAARTH